MLAVSVLHDGLQLIVKAHPAIPDKALNIDPRLSMKLMNENTIMSPRASGTLLLSELQQGS